MGDLLLLGGIRDVGDLITLLVTVGAKTTVVAPANGFKSCIPWQVLFVSLIAGPIQDAVTASGD